MSSQNSIGLLAKIYQTEKNLSNREKASQKEKPRYLIDHAGTNDGLSDFSIINV